MECSSFFGRYILAIVLRISHFRRPDVLWGAVGAILAFLLYFPFIAHDFIGIDDPGFITQNPLLHPVSGTAMLQAFGSYTMLLYLPVTILSYQVDASIAGIEPWMFHLTNILLHAGCTFLVFKFSYRLTGQQRTSAVAALLFAVHPLQTEAVLWAAARKDLLAAFFSLLSLMTYLRWIDSGDGKMRAWSIVLYACALLAKIAVFPLCMTFFFVDWMRGRERCKTLFMEKWPYLIIMIPLMIAGVYGGSRFLAPLGFSTGALLALKSIGYTMISFLWPAHLSLLHFQSEPVSVDAWMIAGIVALIIMIGVMFTRVRHLAFGAGFFLLMLFPTWAAAQKGGLLFFASDKYAYLPSLGIFLLCGMLIEWLVRLKPKLQFGFFTAMALAIVACAGISANYAMQWKTSETLFTSIVERDPQNPVALNGLGLILDEQQQNDEALALYTKAISAYPLYLVPYINAAAVLAETGRTQGAIDMYARIADHITSRQVLGDPSLRDALVAIALELDRAGKRDVAARLRQQLP